MTHNTSAEIMPVLKADVVVDDCKLLHSSTKTSSNPAEIKSGPKKNHSFVSNLNLSLTLDTLMKRPMIIVNSGTKKNFANEEDKNSNIQF